MPSECLQNVDCLRLLCLTSLPIIFPTVCRLQLTRDHLDFPLSWAVDLVKNVARWSRCLYVSGLPSPKPWELGRLSCRMSVKGCQGCDFLSGLLPASASAVCLTSGYEMVWQWMAAAQSKHWENANFTFLVTLKLHPPRVPLLPRTQWLGQLVHFGLLKSALLVATMADAPHRAPDEKTDDAARWLWHVVTAVMAVRLPCRIKW